MKYFAIFLLTALYCYAATAQVETPRNSYETQFIDGQPPVIDGSLDDSVWDQVKWGGDFIQRMPEDGAAPTYQTKFKILYDAKYLYVGILALDDNPETVARRMSRRDGFEGDFVEINIDSYADKRTAFSFSASASGVKGEEYISNNGESWDETWDPIWYLKTSIVSEGWVAEFKIPLSQLRFADKDEHVWGLQVMRMYFSKSERSYWQPIAQDAPGWVHLFGELRGIKGIKPQKQLEIQPYLVAKTERFEAQAGNPYYTGKSSDLSMGVDAKVGITSDITLDLTINPDFGQVEADPSRVNLSAFQLFFQERRPFFLEGNNILNFSLTDSWAGGPFNNDNLFYSRRIGARPKYYPSASDIAYVDRMTNTHILGAAKLTGKNKNGFSWGLLESVTKKEHVEVQDTLGERREVSVEPLTNYLVGRVQQDIHQGNAIIGGMFTATNRDLDEPQFNDLHRNAYSAGVDYTQNFFNRNYYLKLNGAYSHVDGSRESIYYTQLSSERYFQRPDNRHKDADSTLTQLNGTGATMSLGKKNGNIVFQTGATMRSPELELNDVGFLMQTDFVSQWTWIQYRILKPFGIFRSIRTNFNQYLAWDFDGVNLYKAVNVNSHLNFKNLWSVGAGITANAENISNADLRGGPAITYPESIETWAYLGTNNQKKLYFELNPWMSHGKNGYYDDQGVSIYMRYQPINALSVALAPSVSWTKNSLQYVDSYEAAERQYLLGKIDQTTYSASLRLNYIITPNLSVEYWGQPFIFRGEYSEFKKVINAGAETFDSRFQTLKEPVFRYDKSISNYVIDEDQDGNAEYSFENPNTNFLQFRSNFVVRWEYIPGSTLFLVWTSSASDVHSHAENDFHHLASDLSQIKPDNIFLFKYTYRFIL